MCLIVLAFQVHEGAPLLVAANRDEFHARPTRDADWWPDRPDVLAGQDLQAGGTWLGVHRSGRFAAVTNYHDDPPPSGTFESRGQLVTDYLLGSKQPMDYLRTIDGEAFAGFNLLLGNTRTLGYLSNRGAGLRELPPGIYGLSNATLDSSWDKVERSKEHLANLVAAGEADDPALFDLLADTGDDSFRAPFVIDARYGTRCSTIVRAGQSGRWQFIERRFDANGETTGDTNLSFDLEDPQ
jgi:uncharacterized protein with NRDE domain